MNPEFEKTVSSFVFPTQDEIGASKKQAIDHFSDKNSAAFRETFIIDQAAAVSREQFEVFLAAISGREEALRRAGVHDVMTEVKKDENGYTVKDGHEGSRKSIADALNDSLINLENLINLVTRHSTKAHFEETVTSSEPQNGTATLDQLIDKNALMSFRVLERYAERMRQHPKDYLEVEWAFREEELEEIIRMCYEMQLVWRKETSRMPQHFTWLVQRLKVAAEQMLHFQRLEELVDGMEKNDKEKPEVVEENEAAQSVISQPSPQAQ